VYNVIKNIGQFIKRNAAKGVAAVTIASGFTMTTAAHATGITWDFAGITGEMSGLGLALVAAGGLAIAGGLVVFGLKRAVGFVLGLFSKVTAK
jgi:hypothetical protein